MGHRLRRRQDDHGFAGPPDPPSPHPRNRERQLPLQGQLGRSRTEERRKGQPLDRSLIRKPYLEVAHFSVEKPAQFRVETSGPGRLSVAASRFCLTLAALAQLETIASTVRLDNICTAIDAISKRLLAEPQLEFRIKVTSICPFARRARSRQSHTRCVP